MRQYLLERSINVACERHQVFQFFSRAENLAQIKPPELGFRIRSEIPVRMDAGAVIDYTIMLYGIPLTWRTEITEWNPPHSFQDTQRKGPYASWVHTHRFIAEKDGATTIEDSVTYSLPFGVLGRIVHPLVARQLKRIFDYRQRVMVKLFLDDLARMNIQRRRSQLRRA
jgi:ligand-binding SRPBCC domain-containing protein